MPKKQTIEPNKKKLTKAQKEMQEIHRIQKIEDHLTVSYSADCHKCHKLVDTNADTWEFSEALYKDNWRVLDGRLLCPDCAKTPS